MAIFYFLWLRSIPSKRRSLFFSKFDCSIESNSQNGTEKMKMMRSEFPCHMKEKCSKLKITEAAKKVFLKFSRSGYPEVFLVKGVLKICSKFTGEHPCGTVIPIKLQSNFIEITFRHGCFPVNLLHIFTLSFTNNNSQWLLLSFANFTGKHLCWSLLLIKLCPEGLQLY